MKKNKLLPGGLTALAIVTALSALTVGCNHSDDPETYTPYAEATIEPITDAPFPVPEFKRPSFPNRTFNVADYGADTTGVKKSTEAFAKAVAAAKEAGGGKILVPAGKYLTGPIQITSENGTCDNIDLHVEKDAEINFSADFADYLPAVLTRWEGMDVMNYSPQVYVKGCTNVALTGEGTLNGQGWNWWQWKGNMYTKNNGVAVDSKIDFTQEFANAVYKTYVRADVSPAVPPEQRFVAAMNKDDLPDTLTSVEDMPKTNKYRSLLNLPEGMWGFLRPSMVQFHSCKNVLIEGVTIEYGPFWMIHPVYSENVIIRNVNVISYAEDDVHPFTDSNGVSYPTGDIPVTGIDGVTTVQYNSKPGNGDGADPDSSKNVLIEDSTFNTSDDVIAIKAGLNEDGWRVNKPSDTIIIRRVKSGNGHGGVTIGSEMSGGVQNVYSYDSELSGDRALRIKTLPGRGGFIKNVYYENIKVKSKIQALEVTSNYQSGTVSPSNFLPETKAHIPVFDGLHYKNISGTACVNGISDDPDTCNPVGESTPAAAIYLEGIPADVNNNPDIPTEASPIKNVTFDNFVINSADVTWNWGDSKFLARFPSTLNTGSGDDKFYLEDGSPKTCLNACVTMTNVKVDAMQEPSLSSDEEPDFSCVFTAQAAAMCSK